MNLKPLIGATLLAFVLALGAFPTASADVPPPLGVATFDATFTGGNTAVVTVAVQNLPALACQAYVDGSAVGTTSSQAVTFAGHVDVEANCFSVTESLGLVCTSVDVAAQSSAGSGTATATGTCGWLTANCNVGNAVQTCSNHAGLTAATSWSCRTSITPAPNSNYKATATCAVNGA